MQKTKAQNDLRHPRRPVSTSVVRCLDSIILKIKEYWLVSFLYENPEGSFTLDEPHLSSYESHLYDNGHHVEGIK